MVVRVRGGVGEIANLRWLESVKNVYSFVKTMKLKIIKIECWKKSNSELLSKETLRKLFPSEIYRIAASAYPVGTKFQGAM